MPLHISDSIFHGHHAAVKANHIVYFDLLKVNETNLTIKNKDAYVIYNDKTYEAVNGVVTVPNLHVAYTNQPVQIAIGNKGTSDATFDVKLAYPEGHMMNPKKLNMGSFTVHAVKNDEKGTFFSWTASGDGKLTLKLDKITSKKGDVEAGITVTVTNSAGIPRQYTLDDSDSNTVVVDVKAGESVSVVIGALPNKQNKYLEATIDVTAAFE